VGETPAVGEVASLGSGVRSGLAYGFLNNLTLRVGNLLLGIVLARLLAPADFGVFAVALTVQAVLANLTDLGMTAYLVQAPDVHRRAPTVMTVGTVAGIALAALMAACAHPMAVQLGSVRAEPVIWVLSLTLVLSGIGSVPTALIQRRFQQGRQLVADGASFVIGNAVAVGMIVAGFGVMSLAWSRVLGQLVAVVTLFAFSRYRDGFGFDREVGREAYRFGLPLVAANVVSWVLLNTDYVLIGHMLGATALGFYVLAFNISSWPTSAITQSLRAVALPAFARARESRRADQAELASSAVGLTLAASAPIGALLMALASPVVLFVYGPKWAQTAAPLAALAAFGAVRPVFDLMSTYLTARGATRSVLAVQVLWAVTLAGVMWAGITLRGITGAGLAHLCVGLLVVLPAYLIALHRVRIRVSRMFTLAVAPLGYAAAAGAVAYGVGRLFGSPLAAVLVAGSLATAGYAFVIQWYLRARLSDLRNWKGAGSDAGRRPVPSPEEPVPSPEEPVPSPEKRALSHEEPVPPIPADDGVADQATDPGKVAAPARAADRPSVDSQVRE
jgi:lipopolysaccharide exporter